MPKATRSALVEAALRVIERDGVAAATTRQIADEASTPLGTVHYWFADKDELLRAVVDSLLTQVRADVHRASERAGSAERLTGAYEAFMAMPVGRQLALFELTTFAIRNDRLRQVAADQYQAYRAAAQEGLQPWREAAEALPGGADALGALLVAVIDAITLASLAEPDSRGVEALGLFAHLLLLAGVGGEVIAEATTPS